MSDCRTFQRAASGYDVDHERALLAAIVTAIAEASRLSDCNVMAIRTAECAGALVSALAVVLALSPSATRSPAAIRRMCDELHKRLRRRVAAAETDPELQHFLARCFRGTDVGGRA